MQSSFGLCKFCGAKADVVHHVQYPKKIGNEDAQTIISVCNRCHEVAHGKKRMKSLAVAENIRTLGPVGRPFAGLVGADGKVYASAESWARALGHPIKPQLDVLLLSAAENIRISFGDETELEHQGIKVYAWPAVATALRVWDHAYVEHGFKGPGWPETARVAYDSMHESYQKLLYWGYKLQEDALASRFAKLPAVSPQINDRLLAAIESLAPRLSQYDAKINEHDLVIITLKSDAPFMREPKEFITAKQACFELGRDPWWLINQGSRLTLAQVVGNTLTERGAENGEKRMERLEGSSVIKSVNTYRRGNLYQVIGELAK